MTLRIACISRTLPAWLWIFSICAAAPVLRAQSFPIPVFNTGTNVSAGKDMKYTIVSDATEGASGPAALVTNAPPPPPDGWGAVPGAKWIAPAADQTNATRPGNKFVGITVYRTTFSLHGLEPTSASLTISFLADDWVDVYLNPTNSSGATASGTHVYAPTQQMFQSPVTVNWKATGFLPEDNVLEFRVNNAGGGPTGLSVAIRGTAEALQTGPPALDLAPTFVSMTATQGSPYSQSDSIDVWIRNAGGGGSQPLQYTFDDSPTCHHTGGYPFAFGLPVATNQLSPVFNIRGYATNLSNNVVNPGYYRTNMHFSAGSVTQDLCMNFLITANPPSFTVGKSGLSFTAQAKVGSGRTQTVPVFTGGAKVDWTAAILSQNDFLTVSPLSGTSNGAPGTVTTAGTLTVGVKPMTNPGTYYGLIEVTPQNPPGLTPLLIAVVYNVTADAPAPDVNTAGMLFVVTPGVTTPSQTLSLFPSTSGSQPFTLTTTGGFLTLTNPTGSLGGATPMPVPISVNVSQLLEGLNQGTITVSGKTINIAALLLPLNAKVATSAEPPDSAELSAERPIIPRATTAGCTPSQVAVIGTTVAGNFSQPAGWPVVYQARVVDDCANPIANASVLLHFSNGDPDLRATLENAATGTYTATWTPVQPGPVTVTTRASVVGSFSASAATAGTVTANNTPLITPHGTVHSFFPQAGVALAPGTMANVTGAGLATTTDMFTQLPLATTMDGTKVTIAGIDVPVFTVDPAQISVQIPAELAPNAAYPIVVTVNGAVSAVDTVLITDASPGISTNPDGTLAAQHLDTTPVTPDNPAIPGEVLNLFGSGFGATSPAVATNVVAPAVEPLARLVNPVQVTVDGTPADISYAGLAQGGIGLYQITFTVPLGANPGNLNVVVKELVASTQNTLTSNTASLPVTTPPPAQ